VTQLEDAVQCPRRYQLAHQVGLSERPKSYEWREDDEPPAAGDARSLGISAHRLLELVPLSESGAPSTQPSNAQPVRSRRPPNRADQSGPSTSLGLNGSVRDILTALARSEALPLGEDDAVLSWVERFLATPYGRGLKDLGDARVRRETPFVLALDAPRVRDFRLLLRGQIDLLVERDGTIDVVDYKTTHRPKAGLEPYQFQLSCYALAARALVGKDLPVRSGIAFLLDEDPSPQFLAALPARETLGAELVQAAQGLMRAQVEGVFPTRPRARCVELGCGYVYRCHGEAGRV
jgi:hypothetical protein